MSNALTQAGYTEPRYHACGKSQKKKRLIGISLSKLVLHDDIRIYSEANGRTGANGWRFVFGETLIPFLTCDDRPNLEGAKYICSPPLRDVSTQKHSGGTLRYFQRCFFRSHPTVLMKLKFSNGRVWIFVALQWHAELRCDYICSLKVL